MFERRVEWNLGLAAHDDVGADHRPVGSGARTRLGELTHEHGGGGLAELDDRQLGQVLELGLGPPGGIGLRNPQLEAVHLTRGIVRALLGVGDAATGGHQVELTGPDELFAPDAVGVRTCRRTAT